jgi:hypothetical protein
MPRRIDPEDLCTAADLAARLGIRHRQTITAWQFRYPDFPAPVFKRPGVVLWLWPDVEAWARRTGRL